MRSRWATAFDNLFVACMEQEIEYCKKNLREEDTLLRDELEVASYIQVSLPLFFVIVTLLLTPLREMMSSNKEETDTLPKKSPECSSPSPTADLAGRWTSWQASAPSPETTGRTCLTFRIQMKKAALARPHQARGSGH